MRYTKSSVANLAIEAIITLIIANALAGHVLRMVYRKLRESGWEVEL
jgi:hypothetical protein